MSELTFRNSLGEWVEMPTVAATEFKKAFGRIFDRAVHGRAIAITRHDAPRAVLISFDEFQALTQARDPSLEALDAEFDALLGALQGRQARQAMATAFASDSKALGQAAVKAVAQAGAKPVRKRR